MNECKAIPKGVAAAEAFAAIGFSGGPFAEAAPDFHMCVCVRVCVCVCVCA